LDILHLAAPCRNVPVTFTLDRIDTPHMRHMDPELRRRLRHSSVISAVLWVLVIALIFFQAALWSILVAGIVGSYFALRDWRVIRRLAHDHLAPPHADEDVRALIDEKIGISEYRQHKEKG